MPTSRRKSTAKSINLFPRVLCTRCEMLHSLRGNSLSVLGWKDHGNFKRKRTLEHSPRLLGRESSSETRFQISDECSSRSALVSRPLYREDAHTLTVPPLDFNNIANLTAFRHFYNMCRRKRFADTGEYFNGTRARRA